MISAFSSLDEDKKSELQEYIVEKGKSFNDKKQWVEELMPFMLMLKKV